MWDDLACAAPPRSGRARRVGGASSRERWRFDAVNELVAQHNAYYPVEARLAMDPRTRDFVPRRRWKPYRRRLLDAEWILERFAA